ncbi:hypothetical protein BC829DRAFT_479743 [Chytridium lagenaria]|nr:hypothetical protein BC829DRAFT_479743 [Chytridium lagenaria]
MFLRRMAYPNRLCDMQVMFGYALSTFSKISNTVLHHIHDEFSHLLDWDSERLTSTKLQAMANTIRELRLIAVWVSLMVQFVALRVPSHCKKRLTTVTNGNTLSSINLL